MGGGILNIAAIGDRDAIIIGNPEKSFFKAAYVKHTPFGTQKFKVDFEGSRGLRLAEDSVFSFKVPRYADLLMDTYLCVDMPNIWSPIHPPTKSYLEPGVTDTVSNQWVPYEFKWIDHLGAKMIRKITVTCGSQTLQEYSGDYLLTSAQRDLPAHKLQEFYEMIGHVPEMMDPASADLYIKGYPNAPYLDPALYPMGPDPSIVARPIIVPLGLWFGQNTHQSFPMCSLRATDLTITITLRPIYELYRIRDVEDSYNQYPYVAPQKNVWYMQFQRFLTPPPDLELTADSYTDTRCSWDTQIHLNSTYCFLADEERNYFMQHDQTYLIRQVREKRFLDLTGTSCLSLESNGLVSSWTWYFQRSDASLRNEWSNYSNWPYGYKPIPQQMVPPVGLDSQTDPNKTVTVTEVMYGSQLVVTRLGTDGPMTTSVNQGLNVDGTASNLAATQPYSADNIQDIMTSVGIKLNGSYRENVMPVGVFNFIEKYKRTTGKAPNGVYCYHYGLSSNSADVNPSGAINMSFFPRVELEVTTIVPQVNPYAQTMVICDPNTGQIVGVNKPSWRIYNYTFVLTVFEEQYNVLTFANGMCGLEMA
jgi:hypothetical protein